MSSAIEYADASPQVRAVFDDIKKSRNVPDVNNFWKYLARDPVTLKRTWESVKQIMAPGRARPAYQGDDLSRGQRQQWPRLLHRQPHGGARKAGMNEAMFGEVDGGHRHGQRDQPSRHTATGCRSTRLFRPDAIAQAG